MNLAGKVCLVTGGSGDIGKSICIEMAKLGAAVIVNYFSDEGSASQIVDEIKKIGTDGAIYKADVASFSQVSEMVEWIYKNFGRIDILVNNAGITRDSLLLRLKEEDWDRVIDINLKGVFNTSKACAKYMVKQRSGKIINISSIVGIYGNIGQTNYAAAKAGIIGFTKSLSKELGSRGITVNTVAPGFIKTRMTDFLLKKDLNISDRIPLKRIGTAEDVAHVVTFLASDKADYITGQIVCVDGGLSL